MSQRKALTLLVLLIIGAIGGAIVGYIISHTILAAFLGALLGAVGLFIIGLLPPGFWDLLDIFASLGECCSIFGVLALALLATLATLLLLHTVHLAALAGLSLLTFSPLALSFLHHFTSLPSPREKRFPRNCVLLAPPPSLYAEVI